MPAFRPGEPILLRELWRGKVWSVRPVTIVEDSPRAIVIYTPAGSFGLFPSDPDGRPLRIPADEWTLGERVSTEHHVLGIQAPGEHHGTLLIWDTSWEFRSWYINIEEPFRRTQTGFDYKDLLLDIVAAPDLSSWRWKDEDEVAEAVARGVFSRQFASTLYAEGERAIARLIARKPPLDEPWEKWRPDPAWRRPEIRQGWEATYTEM